MSYGLIPIVKNTIFTPMNVWLNRILLVIVSLSFFISASEIDLGAAHNTFFDEYDTYQKADDISLNSSDECQTPENKPFILNEGKTNSFVFAGRNRKEISSAFHFIKSDTQDKLFIFYSVWRI
ncbi:MAG: hypothetical protein KGL19_09985 [Bacteroidota bacterium]|nr:hypothetical protein [Bacteroidota bacterium]